MDGQLTTESVANFHRNQWPSWTGIRSWHRAPANVTGIIPFPPEMELRLGGHAICVVGYNDNQGQFIFKNSWGTGWGNKGYGSLPYDYVKAYCLEAWGLRGTVSSKRPGPKSK